MKKKNAIRLCWMVLAMLAFGQAARAQAIVSGQVMRPNGTPLRNAPVLVTGTVNDFALTDQNGNYAIALPIGGTYQVQPYVNTDHLNGVGTFDLVLISRHMNGDEPFTSPFQYIAADVTNDEVIDSADIVEARRLMLGIIPEFTHVTSWRFVPKSYVFPDPDNPFEPDFPQGVTLTNLAGNVDDVDFWAVKSGDINQSAITLVTPDAQYLSHIAGSVHADANGNCQPDAGETPLAGWTVVAYNAASQFTTTTRPDGSYALSLPADTYAVYVVTPNWLWDGCPDTVTNVVTTVADTAVVDFSAAALADCPWMEVDLAAPFLRRCFTSNYHVRYCNQGTATANDAYVDVTLDPFLSLHYSPVPYIDLGNNTIRFELGDVPVGFCDAITIQVNVSCDATLGQTHCSSAHIYPDSLCGSSYAGASLEVQASCDGDNVVFTITNTGAAMTAPACYVVIEDVMVQMTGNCIQLGAGESETITVPANGSTWRLEIGQPEDHPWNSVASAILEGCGQNGTGTFTTGIVPQFASDDAAPFEDVDCQPNIGAYDPNDKQGFPLGVGAQHFVPRDQEIEYMIRFQNTGTDTAFTVLIRDTLSALLDVATLRVGASSHPYTYSLVGPGVLQFVFANIMLPDSNVNEPASHGFVQFAIRPLGGLPNGTAVENQAGIYFDFNAPIITNRTRHTFGENFLSAAPTVFEPGLAVDVFPNPTATTATFFLQSPRPLRGQLRMFDARGRQVTRQEFDHNQFEFQAGRLPAGLYFFRIEEENGKALASGRLVVQGR